MKTAKQRSLSKSNIKFELSWEDYLCLIDQLVNKIKLSKIKFDYCHGIDRGGLIPSVIISHDLKIIYVDRFDLLSIDMQLKSKYHKNVLLIDDILDTGETIMKFKNKMFTHPNIKVYVATIFKHTDSPITSDFYVQENITWIRFPYEKD